MATATYDELKIKYQNRPQKDNQVSCKVIAKLKDGYLVDVNDEWEGFVPASHMLLAPEEEQDPHVSFTALVVSGPDKSDRYVVSPKELKEKSVWQELLRLKEENSLIKVKISRPVKGGAEIYIDGIRAFLPGRYIRIPGLSPNNWSGQEVDVLIEEINYNEKKLILNQRKAWEIQRQKQASTTLQTLKEGDILDVPVLRIADFGVFVDLGGLDGLIPASELSWGRFNHPREIMTVGQKVRARVFRIERENQRVALSIKQLLGDPWEDIETELFVGKQLTGKVIGEAKFGLFIELKPGIEALLHNSEVPQGSEKPKVGSTVDVRIVKMDIDQRKIGVSLLDLGGESQESQSVVDNQLSDTIVSEETTNQEEQIQDSECALKTEDQNKQEEESTADAINLQEPTISENTETNDHGNEVEKEENKE